MQQLNDFIKIVEGHPEKKPCYASDLQKHIPIYNCPDLIPLIKDNHTNQSLQAEWTSILMEGAGILVLKSAYSDLAVIDDATAIFQQIIEEERSQGSGGDHFAEAGTNDRIWNALEKLCMQSPQTFIHYFANEWIATIAQAWLGPRYQMTAQVNVVHPGGKAQHPHRDYHLGFQTPEQARLYPPHVHALSPVLTLQGAIAHCQMPIASGPTKLLPYSQKYLQGYITFHQKEFQKYFESHYVQIPLEKGDALFFNPAIFHAAGANDTRDMLRMANLLQISSAYGRAMENVDRLKMSLTIFPILLQMVQFKELSDTQCHHVLTSCCEGYPFPTNLDQDPPIGGLAPPAQFDLVKQAIQENWTHSQLVSVLNKNFQKKLSH